MSMVDTKAGEIGEALAENIREQLSKATAGSTLATYIESAPPTSWAAMSDAGWDLAGLVEDDEGASLRDLVEIGLAWGETLIQLPLITSMMVKRHSPEAAQFDGPVTLGVALQTLPAGKVLVPFGQMSGIGLATALGQPGEVIPVPGAEPQEYAPSLLAAVSTAESYLSADARRELAVVWAAEAAGRARAVLQHAIEFVQEREQFNRPIGSFQAVKHHLADAHIAAEMAETSAIWASLDPEESARAVRQSLRESQKSMHRSVQTFGGLGFTWEMGLHFSLRHVTALRELAEGVARG
jgi:hypothetical protein